MVTMQHFKYYIVDNTLILLQNRDLSEVKKVSFWYKDKLEGQEGLF